MSLYLSCLTLDARHPRTRSELDHPYELHRTICKAWDDPEGARVLFRPEPGLGTVRVIVQSLTRPDWSRLDVPSGYLTELDGPQEVNLDELCEGQPLAFRLRCRPSKRIGEPGNADEGKRKSLKDKADILYWLRRKADENGFRVADRERENKDDETALWLSFDRVYWFDSKEGKQAKPLGGVQFDGVLVVTDPEKLREAVRNGVGPQKAYGFGLLSLATIM